MNPLDQSHYQQQFMALLLQPSASETAGISVYQRNRWAQAERALRISFPTVAALMGENFYALAKQFLLAEPHQQADWGSWGENFSRFINQNQHHIGLPYLAAVAQVDWAIHLTERQDNDLFDSASLDLLAEQPAEQLGIRLNSNICLLQSPFPLWEIWKMHQPKEDLGYWSEQAQLKMEKSAGDFYYVISRAQWNAVPVPLSSSDYQFMQGTLAQESIAQLLDRLSPFNFDFSQWLPKAMTERWIQSFYLLSN